MNDISNENYKVNNNTNDEAYNKILEMMDDVDKKRSEQKRNEYMASLVRKSTRNNGARSIHVKKQDVWLKAKIIAFLTISGIAVTVTLYTLFHDTFLWAPIQRKIDLHNANEYMSNQMPAILTEAGVDFEANRGNIVISSDEQQLKQLKDVLEEKGFEDDVACYAVYASCGTKSLENYVAGAEGIKPTNGRNVLESYGISRGYCGCAEHGDFCLGMLENNSEQKYVDSVNNLKKNNKTLGM